MGSNHSSRISGSLRLATFVICIGGLSGVPELAPAQTNTTTALQSEWRFSLDEGMGPAQPGFDDSGWSAVHVPHNGREVSDETPRSMRRVWFRRRFQLELLPSTHRVIVEVIQARTVEVWINGHPVKDDSEFTGTFHADITDAVHTGDNWLAIRTAVPGIQGGVQVRVRGPVHLASDSVQVDTPEWNGGPAAVRVRSLILNQGRDDRTIESTATVTAPNGSLLAQSKSGRRSVGAGESFRAEMTSLPITDPPLWSPASPRLCQVELTLRADGEILETRKVDFGFRWFRFDAEQGFFLNGRPLKLRGVVYAKVGPLRTLDRQQLWEYETGLLKDMGLNFVRSSRMIDETFLSACDRTGLLATVQIPPDQNTDDVEATVRAVVGRHYNHPSIISWHFNGEGKSAEVAAVQSATAGVLRRVDPTRPVLCVELGWRAPGSVGLTDTDIAGQGNYTGWYEGTLDHIGPYMDDYRELLKERYGHTLPVVISNYGAAGDSQVHANRPRRNDYSHEYLTRFHERFEQEITSRPWVAGGLAFTFRDLQSAQPIPRHTWKGVIDLHENKKDAYYFYQSVWSDRPIVHIEQKSWTPRDVWPANSAVPVRVFSNCDDVVLSLNGEPLHKHPNTTDHTWMVSFRGGANTLRAVGTDGGRQYLDTATVNVRFRPPATEVSLNPSDSRSATELTLNWNPIADVDSWQIYGAKHADFVADPDTLIATTRDESITMPRISGDFHYRVVAVSGTTTGEPSAVVGSGVGAVRWRFATGGWVLSSPALYDLNGDGSLEIVFGSYDDWVYALNNRGSVLWKFDAAAPVFSSPAVAELRQGEGPSVVIASSRALHVLDASGRQRWTQAGIRQFDRNDKSPAVGDLDGDGELEIAVGSDTGEILLLNADGTLRWKYSTAAKANRGLCVTTPMFVRNADRKNSSVVFSADDGCTYLLGAEGQLLWRHDNHLGETVPGLPPNFHYLAPAVGALETGGPTRIVVGAGHLKVLDLDGNPVWQRKDLSGGPQISKFSNDDRRHIVLVMRRNLQVVDASGNDAWRFTLDHPRDYFLQPPVCADVNGDDISDLIAGTRATLLLAIDGSGRPLWNVPTDDEVSGTAAVADVDGDGRTEVIFGSRDGYLRMIGGGVTSANPVTSMQYRGGVSRRGAYPD